MSATSLTLSTDVQEALAPGNAPGQPGSPGIGRERKPTDEKEIALNSEPECKADRLQFQETEAAEVGTAKSKIRQPEKRIAILVEFGRKPCAGANGIEEADHRNMINVTIASIGKKGAQL